MARAVDLHSSGTSFIGPFPAVFARGGKMDRTLGRPPRKKKRSHAGREILMARLAGPGTADRDVWPFILNSAFELATKPAEAGHESTRNVEIKVVAL